MFVSFIKLLRLSLGLYRVDGAVVAVLFWLNRSMFLGLVISSEGLMGVLSALATRNLAILILGLATAVRGLRTDCPLELT